MMRVKYLSALVATLGLALLNFDGASVHALVASQGVQASASEPPLVATPKGPCGPGSRPETDLQGRVPASDYENGRVNLGYRCNAQLVGSFLPASPDRREGGMKVERYVDRAGRECAYYDSTQTNNEHGMGVYVLDMSDPARPVQTATLTTPAMLLPHESLVLSKRRGLLAAVAGSPTIAPGIVDVYDVRTDCRHPVHLSSFPTGLFGHESGFAPDGRTFYASSYNSGTLVAVDLDDPRSPEVIWATRIDTHGVHISDDGNRAYVAAVDIGDAPAEFLTGVSAANLDGPGLLILDTSEIQTRRANPQVRGVSALTWSTVSVPQTAIPVTIAGRPYVVEVDEFGSRGRVGAARIIDIADERHPFVVSNLRLEVHQPENRDRVDGDPGALLGGVNYAPARYHFGYSAHFCNVPTRRDPVIVACGMAGSGLRVFNIRDAKRPREVAYFNAPLRTGTSNPANALASPAFAPERREIWYTDQNSGFYAIRLTNDVWPSASSPRSQSPAPLSHAPSPSSRDSAPPQSAIGTGTLPVTGGSRSPLVTLGCLAGVAVLLIRRWRRRTAVQPVGRVDVTT